MPKLPTYTAPLGELPISGGRRAGAEDFGAGIGAGLQDVAKSAQRAEADIGEAEARKALVSSTEIRAKYAARLDQAAVTGEDTNAIKAQMNDDLSKVGDNLYTPKGQYELQLHTASSNIMFDQQANTIAVKRAATDARVEASKFLNSTAALIQTNPLYLSVAEKDAEAFGATLTRVPVETRAEIVNGLQNELNASAAMASSRINPQQAKADLEAGKWNLTPEQRRQAISQAETTIRSQRAEEDHARALKEYQERELNDTARDEHFKSIIDNTAQRGAIMNDARLQPATREHLISLMEVRARELATQEKVSDPITKRNLWLDINAPDGDPRKIYTADKIFAAVQAGRLNTTDANNLNTLVAQQKDENGKTIGSNLNGLMHIVGTALSQDPRYIGQPALVAGIQMDYQARVYDKVKRMRDAGEDPNDAFNPASKNFVGSREFIQGSVDQVTANARGAAVLSPKTQEEYNAIPAGVPYRDTDGVVKVKKAGAATFTNEKGPVVDQIPGMTK